MVDMKTTGSACRKSYRLSSYIMEKYHAQCARCARCVFVCVCVCVCVCVLGCFHEPTTQFCAVFSTHAAVVYVFDLEKMGPRRLLHSMYVRDSSISYDVNNVSTMVCGKHPLWAYLVLFWHS